MLRAFLLTAAVLTLPVAAHADYFDDVNRTLARAAATIAEMPPGDARNRVILGAFDEVTPILEAGSKREMATCDRAPLATKREVCSRASEHAGEIAKMFDTMLAGYMKVLNGE